jgi:DNA polymerase bacteriophage-type
MPTFTYDIETRSTADLGDVGVHVYAAHPDTEVQCLSWCVDDGPVQIWQPPDPPPPEFICAAVDPDWVGVAHNAAFEHLMVRYKLGPLYGFPEIPLERTFCTMAMAQASALPGALEKVAKALRLEHQKDKAGARLMLQMAKPRKPRKGEDPNGTYWFDDPERYAKLFAYCCEDTAAERELYQKVADLPAAEREVWLLDQKINETGFCLDQELASAAARIIEAMGPRISAELTELTDACVTAHSQVPKLKEWFRLQVPHIPITSLDKEAIEALLTHPDLPTHVHRALELRLLGAQAATAKVAALLSRVNGDGRLRGAFVYHAAGTGRWSSRGAQVHNLKRPLTEDLDRAIQLVRSGDVDAMLAEYANPLAVIGDCVRGMIIAAPGKTFIGGDFSGIEARVVAWLAGEERALDMFRAYDAGGPDPYVVTAARILNLDPIQLAADYKAGKPQAREARQVGKACVLAFGFQGGVPAYRRFAPDTTLNDREIDRIKVAWRNAHPHICQLWDDLEFAARKAVRNPGRVVHCGMISFECDAAPYLWMTLPSGRRLAYPHARLTNAYKFEGKLVEHARGQRRLLFKDNSSGRWHDVEIYGGFLAENATQATARDLLAEAMIRLDSAGGIIVLHVHDEVVIEVPIADAARAEKKFSRLMTEAAAWAAGLPIRVGTWTGQRFTK